VSSVFGTALVYYRWLNSTQHDPDTILFCSQLPAFVPVHESKRKAYQGILGTKTHSARFEADRITSWVPVRFMHLEGLYDLFVSKLVNIHVILFILKDFALSFEVCFCESLSLLGSLVWELSSFLVNHLH
jgi:hypothetical protein